MSGWSRRVRADVAASAPESPEPPRRRGLRHAVLICDRPGTPDGLSDSSVRTYDEALKEADGWNRSLTAGRAVVVELREIPC